MAFWCLPEVQVQVPSSAVSAPVSRRVCSHRPAPSPPVLQPQDCCARHRSLLSVNAWRRGVGNGVDCVNRAASNMWPSPLQCLAQIHRRERKATSRKNRSRFTDGLVGPRRRPQRQPAWAGGRGMPPHGSLGPTVFPGPHTDLHIFSRHLCFKAEKKRERERASGNSSTEKQMQRRRTRTARQPWASAWVAAASRPSALSTRAITKGACEGPVLGRGDVESKAALVSPLSAQRCSSNPSSPQSAWS